VRVVSSERQVRQGDEPTLGELREALIAVYGTDYGVHNVTNLSRFTDATRQAASYRERRVLLAATRRTCIPRLADRDSTRCPGRRETWMEAGPGGNGTSPESLLDTYQAERHPVAARALRNTMAITALNRGDERTNALRETMASWLRWTARASDTSGCCLDWTFATTSAPDTRCSGAACPTSTWSRRRPPRVFTLLHDARPVLLNLGEPGALDITPWTARVNGFDGSIRGVWESSRARRGRCSHCRVDSPD